MNSDATQKKNPAKRETVQTLQRELIRAYEALASDAKESSVDVYFLAQAEVVLSSEGPSEGG